VALDVVTQKAVEDIVRDDEFWLEMNRRMALGVSTVSRHLIMEGARAAESVGVIVDFDLIHREALQMTRTTASRFWGVMTQTTRDGLQEALITWQETGLGKRGLPDLIDSLEPLFGKPRAKRVAVTEATRLFGEGNKLAAQQDDMTGGLEWQTANDEMVCPLCAPRHMLIYPKDRRIEHPAHVNCRCALIPVSWQYIREHLDMWQGGQVPSEEALERV